MRQTSLERAVQYVRGSFFAGEEFGDLADAQARAQTWCAYKAGLRIHGTTCAQPAVVFTEHEAALLLPAPERTYRVPIYTEVTVHRDYHVQIDRALYSIPEHLLKQRFTARADEELVKLFHRGQLVKTHPRQAPGHRSTDPADLPAEKTAVRQVLCVCNFAPKNVAGVTSEVLVTGAYDHNNKVVLAGFDHPVPNGSRLS